MQTARAIAKGVPSTAQQSSRRPLAVGGYLINPGPSTDITLTLNPSVVSMPFVAAELPVIELNRRGRSISSSASSLAIMARRSWSSPCGTFSREARKRSSAADTRRCDPENRHTRARGRDLRPRRIGLVERERIGTDQGLGR